MTTGKAWTVEELQVICKVYAEMLLLEAQGVKFNKAANRRATLPLLDGRSGGSYEMKCCNISAVLHDMGAPFIKGYKPLDSYQRCIKPIILAAIDEACKPVLQQPVKAPCLCPEFSCPMNSISDMRAGK
jgi:hypothetical protein